MSSFSFLLATQIETMKAAWISILVGVIFCIDAAPICLYEEIVCHVPSLADLFDRVIQQSSKVYSISSDLHSQIGEFFPSRNSIGKQKCHTHWIVTPGDKEKAQRLGHAALTEVITSLLSAWDEPLSELHWSMSQNHNEDLNQAWTNMALQIGHMVRELREGVLKVALKMRPLDVKSNILSHMSPDLLDPFSDVSFYKHGELRSLDHHDLLHCFRRDSNKIQTYLGILKCSIVPELYC